MESNNFKLIPIDELCREYNLSKYSIYSLIKNDPTFPCINIGPRKNYRIPYGLFMGWLEQRLKERHYYEFKVPTAEQLYKTGRS